MWIEGLRNITLQEWVPCECDAMMIVVPLHIAFPFPLSFLLDSLQTYKSFQWPSSSYFVGDLVCWCRCRSLDFFPYISSQISTTPLYTHSRNSIAEEELLHLMSTLLTHATNNTTGNVNKKREKNAIFFAVFLKAWEKWEMEENRKLSSFSQSQPISLLFVQKENIEYRNVY